MSLYPRRKVPSPPRGKSEFEILKSAHKFLRPDEDSEANKSWDDQLARKYYDSLYKEYALCDLKHYKSGNFALRWRTENEVLAGSGEETCGNTRCSHHDRSDNGGKLTPVELPFVYSEEGQTKSALVKVVLCRKCLDKLMYKHRKEKAQASSAAAAREMNGKVKLEEDDDVRVVAGPSADDRGDSDSARPTHRGRAGHEWDNRDGTNGRAAGSRSERASTQHSPSPHSPRHRRSPSLDTSDIPSRPTKSVPRHPRHSRSRSPGTHRSARDPRRW